MKDLLLDVWPAIVIFVVGMVFVGVMVWTADRSKVQWRHFLIDHDCHAVDDRVVRVRSGKVRVLTKQVGWLCDDGVLYWK